MHPTGERPTRSAPTGQPPTSAQTASIRSGGTRLLVAGFVGSHLVGLPVILLLTVLGGATGAVSAAVGVSAVLVYRVLGQWVSLRAAGQLMGSQMAVAMGSLLVRMVGLLALVLLWFALPADVQANFDVTAVAAGLLAAEVGWTGGLVLTSLRTRVQAYDPPVSPPVAGERS